MVKPGVSHACDQRCTCIQSRHATWRLQGSPAAGAGRSIDARLKGGVALNNGPVSVAPESIHLHRTCL